MANTVFCLDIGEKFIKAVDIEQKKDSLLAHAATYSEYSSNPYLNNTDEMIHDAATIVSKIVAEAKFNKREVNIVIPDTQSYTRILDMPSLTDKELISAVKYQADQFIPIPIDKVNLDVYTLSRDKKANKSRILLVAAAAAIIDVVTKIAEGAALLPQSVENETSATLRYLLASAQLKKTESPTPGANMFVNFGYTSSTIFLMDAQTSIPIQVHNFPLGVELFKRDIKASFPIDENKIDELFQRIGFSQRLQGQDLNTLLASPLNEFVSEFRRFLISSKDLLQGKILNVYLFGEGSKIMGIDAKLTALLGSPVKLYSPYELFENNQVSDYFKNDWQMLIPTIGGALR